MRIRTIKPDFWRSDDVAALSIENRLLFIGLWSYVDDNGVGRDSVQLIQCDLFPLDPLVEGSLRVQAGLEQLAERGLIIRFEGPDGRRYLQVVSWARHQRINRPSKPRYPHYDAESCTLTDVSPRPHDRLTEGSPPEQGAGTREAGSGKQEPLADEGNVLRIPDGQSRPEAGPEADQPGADDADADIIDADPADAHHSRPAEPTRSAEPVRDDVEQVCKHMAGSVQERTGRPPAVTRAWRTAARLMLDRDGRTVADCVAAIDWAARDDFWSANILSLPKLRKHYDQLSLQARRRRRPCAVSPLGNTDNLTEADWRAVVNDLWTPADYRRVVEEEAS